MDKWNTAAPVESRTGNGLGGDVIPDQFLDLEYVGKSIRYPIGQTLKLRTFDGVVPVRITKYEIHYSYASGHFYLYSIVEPLKDAVKSGERVIAADSLHDCGKSCALSRAEATSDESQKARAVAVEKLGVTCPADIRKDQCAETLIVYRGQFTRADVAQYVAFFARHSKDTLGEGNWATFVLDSDFSLISILGRDDYLRIIPDGVADVNGDGFDEIWSDDSGFEGAAYSIWFLNKEASPVSFRRLQWEYFGL
jgi:hypothetical protein